MAKIEFVPEDETPPALGECIEVRAWGMGGTAEQSFSIGSGGNFNATGNVWLEFIYSVAGAQIFYTRTFLHCIDEVGKLDAVEARLDELVEKGEGGFGFGDMLPETNLILRVENRRCEDADRQEQFYQKCELRLAADTGAVFGGAAPGERFIDIRLPWVALEDGVRFMREVIHDLDEAFHGRHPDPACLPPGSSEWPFVRRINRKAYDAAASDYQEAYFKNPLVTRAFDDWLALLPAGAQVLDAGCGHGDPVITRMLEKGMQVTGTDFSPAMLRRARERFPRLLFVEKDSPEIDFEAQFDGVCSFSSILYLDPVDLFHSIYRLHRALKPGGLLFLYGWDSHPSWRGTPLHLFRGEWMWSWVYSKEEAANAVAEHGYFELLSAVDVTTDEEREALAARVRAEQEEANKKFEQEWEAWKVAQAEADSAEARAFESEEPFPPSEAETVVSPPEDAMPQPDIRPSIDPNLLGLPTKLPYHYVIIARRLER